MSTLSVATVEAPGSRARLRDKISAVWRRIVAGLKRPPPVLLALCVGLGLVYLIAVPLGWLPGRLQAADVVIAIVLLLIASGLLQRVEEFAFSDKGWSVKLRSVEEKQARLEGDVVTLRFLVAHILTEFEVAHLKNLAATAPFHFTGYKPGSPFRDELYRLRRHGFIAPIGPTRMSRDVPEEGPDLGRYLQLTDVGRYFLALYDREVTAPGTTTRD